MRFTQIYDYVEKHKPGVLMETGTWNGKSAKHMLKLGAKKYVGFDVWDEGTEELDKIENNVKAHAKLEDVQELLKDDDVELIQGNTRYTLPRYAKGKERFVDVAIIDGGHSVPTIKSDFLHILSMMKTDGVIFIDDYYFLCTDVKIGANAVMGDLNVPYTVLPKVDKAKDGYLVKIVKVDMRDVPTKHWEMSAEQSWTYQPSTVEAKAKQAYAEAAS